MEGRAFQQKEKYVQRPESVEKHGVPKEEQGGW